MNLHGFVDTVKAGGITLGVILVCSILAQSSARLDRKRWTSGLGRLGVNSE